MSPNNDQYIDDEPWSTLQHVCLRPRMYLETRSLRDVLILLQGVALGADPPHGCLRMNEFISDKFGCEKTTPWPDVLEREFENEDFFVACQRVGEFISEFRASTE